MSNLTLIEWKDDEGKAHDFRIINQIKHTWWQAEMLLESEQDSEKDDTKDDTEVN